jgi:hypothetical protein
MKSTLAVALLFVALVAPGAAQYGPWRPAPVVPRHEVRNLNGTWYMNGDPDKPCQIIQDWPLPWARFVNEHGSEASGQIRGDTVWIPDWSDGINPGLAGRIRGDRIIWPNGSFWSR